jgi:hypothetical protein
MRITFVVPGYAHKAVGGIRVVYNYANGLAARGHDVTVAHVALFRTGPNVRAGRPVRRSRSFLASGRDLVRRPPSSVSWQTVDEDVRLT